MKNYSKYLIFSLLLAFACNNADDQAKKKEELQKLKAQRQELNTKISKLEKQLAASDTTNKPRTKTVAVTELKPMAFTNYITVQGVVESEENIMVSPKTPGLITRIHVTEGQAVRKGQVLVELDASILASSINELKTRLELAKTTYEKQQRLWEQKIGTEMQYLTAKNTYESLENSLKTLQEQYAQTRITSPINGIVDNVPVKVGESANPGMGVARVVNFLNLKVVAEVADSYISNVKKGDKVKVVLPDLNDTIEANISYVSKVVDPSTRTFKVEVDIKNKNENIRPNLLAVIHINDYTNKEAVVINGNMMQRTPEGYVAFIAADSSGKKIAEKRNLKIGASYNGQVEVLEGLKAGDLLVTSGYQDLVDNQSITF